jgi:predicted nucleic acid-binding protein
MPYAEKSERACLAPMATACYHAALLRKYADGEMDLADACIVRMTELMRDSRVVTVDRADFSVYRRNGRELIPLIAPPG